MCAWGSATRGCTEPKWLRLERNPSAWSSPQQQSTLLAASTYERRSVERGTSLLWASEGSKTFENPEKNPTVRDLEPSRDGGQGLLENGDIETGRRPAVPGVRALSKRRSSRNRGLLSNVHRVVEPPYVRPSCKLEIDQFNWNLRRFDG